MPDPLLSQEDRAEILRMYTEMKSGYSTLSTLISESKPTGEIKLKLEKIDEAVSEFTRSTPRASSGWMRSKSR